MSKARDIVETLRTVLVDGDVTNANFTGADLELGKGGTGASTAGAARTALGLAIGTDVLAPDGDGSALTGVDSLPSQSSQSGKFLTTNGSAASWGDVGGAGVWEYISTTNASTSSTVDFETFPSAYKVLKIVFDIQLSQNADFFARIKGQSTPVYSTTEAQHDSVYKRYDNIGEIPSWSSSVNQTKLQLSGGGGVTGLMDIVGQIHLHHPNDTSHYPRVTWELEYPSGSTDTMYTIGYGGWSDNHVGLSGFRIFGSGGTITGEFKLYGLSI